MACECLTQIECVVQLPVLSIVDGKVIMNSHVSSHIDFAVAEKNRKDGKRSIAMLSGSSYHGRI
jgi:hypothetical protein